MDAFVEGIKDGDDSAFRDVFALTLY
jgi:hypothetical protein